MRERGRQNRNSLGPIRTCIATQTQHPAAELLRVVARCDEQGAEVVPDPDHRMPGRGAWITPTVAAYEQAVLKRAFHRAFKTSEVSTKQLGDYLAAGQDTTIDHRKI